MSYKTKTCHECLASFVEETKNQKLCNECLLFEQREQKTAEQTEKPKYIPVYRKNYRRKTTSKRIKR